MDWALAIDRNREALLRIVARMFAMAGMDEAGIVETLPRYLRTAVFRILRPAEAAARRLVLIAAHDIVVVLPPRRTVVASKGSRRGSTAANEPTCALAIVDPLPDPVPRPFYRRPVSYPRITCLGLSEPRPIPENWIARPGDEVDAKGLCRRLAALKRALDDLPGHAKRLARWRARRDRHEGPCRFHEMRPGRPPGHRRRAGGAVDEVLRECHALAIHALKEADTS
ncbi:hypothetical protein [Oricola sp.]|uniref:hypothetical protein n=1 Tax=Oricola sp. TaxID=1979950 RepID=UPI0025CDA100|nr:hypothetical protein [Oricola sp.]MCI5073841.1 hypothetical protein [Oricola sp.]